MSLIFLKVTFKFNILRLIRNMTYPVIASLSILVSYCVLRNILKTRLLEMAGMCISALLYLAIVVIFFRKDLLRAKNKIQNVKL